MRRVIYAWNYVEWGGAQIHFLGIIKAARKEFDVVVVLPKGTDQEFLGFLEANNILYQEFEPAVDLSAAAGILQKLRRRWRRLGSEHNMIRTVRELSTENTIVHTDILPTQSLLSLIRLCRKTNVFITSHNALPKVSPERWYWMRCKFLALSMFKTLQVFCTNEHAAKYFKRLYSKRVADKIGLTFDSINPEEVEHATAAIFDRDQERRAIGVSPEKVVVLVVGQFIDRKGRWILLDAAKQIAATEDNIEFVWLTSSHPDENDFSRIAAYELRDRFHLVSASAIGGDRSNVLRFFRIGDIYALPSFVEGLPISLLEAMAMGLPAISTNVYGIPEAITHEETGLLIEAGDSDSLAAAILRLKNDPDLCCRLAEAGREHVLRSFDEREVAKIAVSEYRRLFDSY